MATVRFPDAEAMESVRSITCGDMVGGSGRSSWVKLKASLSNGGIQVILRRHMRNVSALHCMYVLSCLVTDLPNSSPDCAAGPGD